MLGLGRRGERGCSGHRWPPRFVVGGREVCQGELTRAGAQPYLVRGRGSGDMMMAARATEDLAYVAVHNTGRIDQAVLFFRLEVRDFVPVLRLPEVPDSARLGSTANARSVAMPRTFISAK